MRRIAIALIVMLPIAAAHAQAQTRRTVDETVPVRADGFVSIINMVGSVHVEAWDQDSLSVRGDVWETKGERFVVHSGEGGAKLGIWDTAARDLKPSHLTVRLPAGSQLRIKTASAGISVAGVTGALDLYSVSGPIRVRGAPRDVYAESMGGDVDVDARARTARIATASGAIRLRGVIEDVTAHTVSGTLTVDGSTIERGRFETVDGDIHYAGALARGSVLDFVSHSGTVELALPSRTQADVTVNTFEGQFQDQFGVRVNEGGGALRGRELTFAIGGGGDARVTVRDFKGTVVLRRR